MPFNSKMYCLKQNDLILQIKYAITNQTYISFVEILHYSPKLFPYGEKITHEFQKQMEVTNQQLHLIAHSPQTRKYLFTKSFEKCFRYMHNKRYFEFMYFHSLPFFSFQSSLVISPATIFPPPPPPLTSTRLHTHTEFTQSTHINQLNEDLQNLFQNDPTKCCRHNPQI